jgi:hypothetical protein
MHVFSGTPQDMMEAILRDLREANGATPRPEAHFARALSSLVGLYDRQAEVGPVPPGELAHFRRESGDAFAALGAAVPNYVVATSLHAETPDDDALYDLAIRRSAIQSLIDDYDGTAAEGLVNPDDVAELDEDLRRVVDDQGPLPEAVVPHGLPEHHWWWR